MYGDFQENKEIKLSLGSIKYLTRQLHDFVRTYEKDILITDPEIKAKFEKLKEISELLDRQRYDVLISDPSYVIDFNDDNEDYLPSYYPI